MDTEFQTESKPKYVHVHCRGIANIDEALRELENAFQLAAGDGRTAILFDILNLTEGSFSTLDRFRAGERVAELQQGRGRGIAVALVGNIPMIDPQRFAETVGVNRGAIFRVFTDINEAVDWIDNRAVGTHTR